MSDDYIEKVFGAGGYLSVKPGYQPRPGQIEMADIIDQVYRDEGEAACIVEAPTGCHAKGQLIMLHTGRLKKVEDIIVGDMLMGPDGDPREVISLCRGRQEMVDIIPVKGEPWRVNLDHILTLQRADRPEEIVDVSVREWEQWSKTKKHLFKLFRSTTPRQKVKSVLRTGFRIEHKAEEDFYGFSLTGDGRFLLGDFTVTHNTGKSFSYLVPAIFHGIMNDVTTVVCTSNKRLQHQLIDRDLPALEKMLPWKFRYSLAKGKTNYVCNERILGADRSMMQSLGLDKWITSSEEGDFQELKLQPEGAMTARRALALARSEECRGSKCRFIPKGSSGDGPEIDRINKIYRKEEGGPNWSEPFPLTCFHHLMKERMARSEIIVTNYHLLFYHYVVKRHTGGVAGLLPPFQAIICDESHNIADIARDVLGEQITKGGIEQALPGDALGQIQKPVDRFFDRLEQIRSKATSNPREAGWLRDDLSKDGDAQVIMHCARKVVAQMTRGEGVTEDGEMNQGALESISNFEERLLVQKTMSIYSRMRRLTTDEFDHLQARFIEPAPRRSKKSMTPILGSKRVHVDGFLKEVWEGKKVIFTSATLSVDGKFSHLVSELGLREHSSLTCAEVESPFRYRDSSLLYIDTDLPDPSRQREAWEQRIPSRIIELLHLNGGSAMCLFTSRRMMNMVASALETLRGELPFRYFVQGSDSITAKQTFEKFVKDKSSVLLGVNTFREGADAPGDTCTMVIMDKIPFPAVNDPVMKALSQGDRNFFGNQMIPRAAIAQKQGIGRLIRSVTDEGVVAILDPRLHTKAYGRMLAGSRPPGMPITRHLHHVQRAIERRKNRP